MKITCCAACSLAEAFAARVKALAHRRNPVPAVRAPIDRRRPAPGAASEPAIVEGDASLLGRGYFGA